MNIINRVRTFISSQPRTRLIVGGVVVLAIMATITVAGSLFLARVAIPAVQDYIATRPAPTTPVVEEADMRRPTPTATVDPLTQPLPGPGEEEGSALTAPLPSPPTATPEAETSTPAAPKGRGFLATVFLWLGWLLVIGLIVGAFAFGLHFGGGKKGRKAASKPPEIGILPEHEYQ
jgi:hypothetical protein